MTPVDILTIKRLGGKEGVEAYNWREKFPRLKGGTLYNVLACRARVIALFFVYQWRVTITSYQTIALFLIIPLSCLRKIEYPIYLVAFQFDFRL